MYRTRYQNRIKRIETIRKPHKSFVYLVNLSNGKYEIRNAITGASKIMTKVKYQDWLNTLSPDDLIILDDIELQSILVDK